MNKPANLNASIIFDREGYLPRRAIGALPSLFEDKRWKKEFPAFNVESPLLYVQVVDDSMYSDGIFPGIYKPFSILSYKDKIGTDGAYGNEDGVKTFLTKKLSQTPISDDLFIPTLIVTDGLCNLGPLSELINSSLVPIDKMDVRFLVINDKLDKHQDYINQLIEDGYKVYHLCDYFEKLKWKKLIMKPKKTPKPPSANVLIDAKGYPPLNAIKSIMLYDFNIKENVNLIQVTHKPFYHGIVPVDSIPSIEPRNAAAGVRPYHAFNFVLNEEKKCKNLPTYFFTEGTFNHFDVPDNIEDLNITMVLIGNKVKDHELQKFLDKGIKLMRLEIVGEKYALTNIFPSMVHDAINDQEFSKNLKDFEYVVDMATPQSLAKMLMKAFDMLTVEQKELFMKENHGRPEFPFFPFSV